MKTNKELGYETIARVGNYSVGHRGSKFRAYGYEWATPCAATATTVPRC